MAVTPAKDRLGNLLTPLRTQIEALQLENDALRAAASPTGGNEELLAQIEALKEGVALASGANERLQSELDGAQVKLDILEKQNTSLGEVLRVANKKNEELEAEIKTLKASTTSEKPEKKKK